MDPYMAGCGLRYPTRADVTAWSINGATPVDRRTSSRSQFQLEHTPSRQTASTQLRQHRRHLGEHHHGGAQVGLGHGFDERIASMAGDATLGDQPDQALA